MNTKRSWLTPIEIFFVSLILYKIVQKIFRKAINLGTTMFLILLVILMIYSLGRI